MKKLAFVFVALVVGLLFLYNIIMPLLPGTQEETLNESRCSSEKRAKEEEVTGVLVKKFLDRSSHMWKTIEYLGTDKSHRTSLILPNDQSGAYDFLTPGDSIIKEFNSLEFRVIRDGSTKTFILDFDCIQININENK